MQRETHPVRPDWPKLVENVGLTFHSHEQGPYWDESASYRLSMDEVLAIERATRDLHHLCIEAADHVVQKNRFAELSIPAAAVPAIIASWERDDFSLYGRFDLALSAAGSIKLLEYNADTPTALVEAAVVQWYWLQDTHPQHDQFNSLHERLVAAWQRFGARHIHFVGVTPHEEDEQTLLYLRDTLQQAGGTSSALDINQLGWSAKLACFVDEDGRPIESCFKLYPWEWLWEEPFSRHLPSATCWLEPSWKMLLSNKGLLAILWELFPDHPLLLPAHLHGNPPGGSYVRKPLLSREGANIKLVEQNQVSEETSGDYGDGPFVYQGLADFGRHGGFTPVLGSWIVDHEPAGLGIREDVRRITGNLSRFVPHYIA